MTSFSSSAESTADRAKQVISKHGSRFINTSIGSCNQLAVNEENNYLTDCHHSTPRRWTGKSRLGHLRPTYQITTRSAWLNPTTGPTVKENGLLVVRLRIQLLKLNKSLSTGWWHQILSIFISNAHSPKSDSNSCLISTSPALIAPFQNNFQLLLKACRVIAPHAKPL